MLPAPLLLIPMYIVFRRFHILDTLFGLIVAISISYAPRVARITRAAVLDVRQEDYVASSVALGARTVRVLARHVLPNVSAPLTVELTLLAGQAVLVATALGFVGLGVQPPLPEWGTMLSRGKDDLAIAPHVVVAPGLALMGWLISFTAEEALFPLLGVALLVACVGIGLLTASKFLERANRDDAAGISSTFR